MQMLPYPVIIERNRRDKQGLQLSFCKFRKPKWECQRFWNSEYISCILPVLGTEKIFRARIYNEEASTMKYLHSLWEDFCSLMLAVKCPKLKVFCLHCMKRFRAPFEGNTFVNCFCLFVFAFYQLLVLNCETTSTTMHCISVSTLSLIYFPIQTWNNIIYQQSIPAATISLEHVFCVFDAIKLLLVHQTYLCSVFRDATKCFSLFAKLSRKQMAIGCCYYCSKRLCNQSLLWHSM